MFVSRYAPSACNVNSLRVLTDNDIMARAPSVFATEAHSSRSERFAYIPTSHVLTGLRNNGWQVTNVQQGRSRIPGKADFTKHVIRLRHAGAIGKPALGDTYPEIILQNAHDGTSAYKLFAGLFRLVCLNGLCVADEVHSTVTIPHKGDVINRVIEGSFEVIEDSKVALESAANWAGITLNQDEQMALAEAAHVARFADANGEITTPVKPAQLLRAQRREDVGNDLWKTFNIIQERVVRGGITAFGRDAENRRRRTTTREITGIDQNLRLNKALWLLAERMAQIKAG
jgi:hypothetical protein